jgi:hypothetical protein
MLADRIQLLKTTGNRLLAVHCVNGVLELRPGGIFKVTGQLRLACMQAKVPTRVDAQIYSSSLHKCCWWARREPLTRVAANTHFLGV